MASSPLWRTLEAIPGAQSFPETFGCGDVILLPAPRTLPGARHTCWMVAEYENLTDFATKLRTVPTLRKFVGDRAIRLGLRDTDLPPVSPDQQKSYGANVVAATAGRDHTGARQTPTHPTVTTINALVAAHTGKTARINPGSGQTERTTDRFENRDLYWEKKTPEAHHIVEFNQLEALGISQAAGTGPLDYNQLPCVLLAAELHQRFVTRILEQTRTKSLATPAEKQAYLRTLREVYRTLYQRDGMLFLPLWDVARVILDAAARQLTA